MTEPILSVSDLRVRLKQDPFSYEIVRGVSYDLHAGRTLALVGESGCGKSLSALSLLKIQPTPPFLPPEGNVIYRSQNLLKWSEKELQKIRGGKIAMIFQDPNNALNAVYTIGNQLMEVGLLHLGMDEDQAFARATEVLTSVGIPQAELRMSDYPHQLSGGMKQRVMIAMALIAEPDILIADEPTTALDVTIQAQVLDLLREIQERTKMAILLITHDMGVVAELAHDVAVMYAGSIIEQASVQSIFDRPLHPYTQGLFKAFKREGEKGNLSTIKGNVPSSEFIPAGCPFHPRCPFAFNKCYHGRVPDFKVGEKQSTKCWLYE